MMSPRPFEHQFEDINCIHKETRKNYPARVFLFPSYKAHIYDPESGKMFPAMPLDEFKQLYDFTLNREEY